MAVDLFHSVDMKFALLYYGYLSSVLLLTACSLGNLVDGAETASDVRDPSVVRTPEGVMGVFNGVNITFAEIVRGTLASSSSDQASYVRIAGLFTDELRADRIDVDFPSRDDENLDSRNELKPGAVNQLFGRINTIRIFAQEARGLLREIKISDWENKVALMYAIEGYANIMLADLYCSSIPLSYLHYRGDYTLTEGFSTTTVYEKTLSIFDSAASILKDDLHVKHFVNLGKGRALLSLGEYDLAAAQVIGIPDNYQYQLIYSANNPKDVPRPTRFIFADREGGNGMPFISENDPRTKTDNHLNNLSPFTFASGVEARLIEIEAMIYNHNDDWINKINSLRTTCTSIINCPTPTPAGTGGISGLPPLSDSSFELPDEAKINKRIDMLFRERAYWLFLSGRRIGDLRRLVRVYGRIQSTVYPTGAWGTQGYTGYGSAASLSVPEDEETWNPLYKRCLSNDA